MSRRILWLTENYPPQRGGMAQSCDRIVDQLRQRGHTVDVLHFTAHDKPLQKIQQLNGWCASVPFDESESHTLNYAWEFIKQQQVDALVCFGGYLPMLAAPIYAQWLNVPLVTLIRGNDFDHAIFTPRKRDMLRDALLAAHTVGAVSMDKVKKIKQLYPAVNVCFTPNGIDFSQWTPASSEQALASQWRQDHLENKLCIGLFGQLKKKKGVLFLLEALHQSSLLDRLHFLLIGELTEDVNQLLVNYNIAYTHYSFLDRYELLKYYLCCDALAIPSFYDGMPNVLLEAGALGIPVLATDVDGMRDVIKDRESGLLFAPGNAGGCRQVFYDFTQGTSHWRKALGLKLKETIASKYSVEHETEFYDKLFKDLLDTDRSSMRLHVQ